MKSIKYILLGIYVLLFGISLYAQSISSCPLDTIDGEIYYRYTVPRGIGIYRIGIIFDVSQEDILQANPHILTKGLHVDDVILIPTQQSVKQNTNSVEIDIQFAEEHPVVPQHRKEKGNTLIHNRKLQRQSRKAIRDSTEKDSTYFTIDSLINDSILSDSTTNVIRLAIVLPLYADAVKRDNNMDRFFDFYAGSLLAINEVQQEGQKIELFTYDVDRTAQTIHLLMQDSTWQHVDAIIGPVYPQQVTAASQYAIRDSIWLLLPFVSNTTETQTNPYILKFNPSAIVSAEAMAEYLVRLGDKVNCVLVESKETDNVPTSILLLREVLKKHSIPITTTTIRNIYTDSIDEAFVEEKENIIIFNTENYNNLHALIPHLVQASNRYQVTLYSFYSWSDEPIFFPQIYTSTFNDVLLIPANYQTSFQEYFAHDVSSTLPRYDLLGYDLTLHLLRMLQQLNAGSIHSPSDTIWNGIITNIQYQKVTPQGGYENQTINIIRK